MKNKNLIYKNLIDNLQSLTNIPKYLHKDLAYLLFVYKFQNILLLQKKNTKKLFLKKEIKKCFDSFTEFLFNIFIGAFTIKQRKLFLKFKKKKNLLKKLFYKATSKKIKEKIILENFDLFIQPLLQYVI